jgi:enamine deaminase RidA (YjgF/YER057c/UK114 family)
MNITAINPHPWSTQLGFDQAELVEGHRRELFCSAQDAVDSTGAPQHPDDLAAQLDLSLANLEEVLAGADMKLADVVRLNVFTTDVAALLPQFPIIAERFEGERFATTVLGVAQLAAPGLVVALEATAVA